MENNMTIMAAPQQTTIPSSSNTNSIINSKRRPTMPNPNNKRH